MIILAILILFISIIIYYYAKQNNATSDSSFRSIDYANTLYSNMRDRFNLPMYIAILRTSDGIAHGLNAIMVGDSVLKYSDWRFIDPQTDHMYEDGKPSPPNSTVSICAKTDSLRKPELVDKDYIELIRFRIDGKKKPHVEYYHPDLVLTRPSIRP